MNTKERLITYLSYKGLSQGKFEKQCGLSNGYVNNIKVSVMPDKLQKIALHFADLNPAWLLTGEGTMIRGENSDKTHSSTSERVPYFDIDVLAGFEADKISCKPDYFVDFTPFNDADMWINVVGNSMRPIINHGDIIALKRVKDWNSFMLYGEMYAIITDDFRTIRVVTKSENNDYVRLVPLNTDSLYCEQDIPKDKIRSIYIVKGSVRRLM